MQTVIAKRALKNAIQFWIGIVFVGQWLFSFYILAQFALPFVTGTLDESQFSHMIKGYENGDFRYNTILLLHVIPVFIIGLTATFQLLPSVRYHFPRFHRINGRFFLSFGIIGALTGMYMTWFGGGRLSELGSVGVTVNGILIPLAVILAWRAIRQKNVALHRRYAVHAFILINGVWTFRLYLMGWFFVNQGPLGNSAKIDGPADVALSFASYLLPMAIAEVVFWAEKHNKPSAALLATCAVSMGVIITLVGVIAASLMMWGPRIIAVFL